MVLPPLNLPPVDFAATVTVNDHFTVPMMPARPYFRFADRRSRRRAAASALSFLLFLATASLHAADVTTTFSSRKSGDVPRMTKETEFTCSDTIYALIETRGLDEGMHEIEIQWFDPRGDRQELTQFSAHAGNTDTLIWGWMRLHPPENSGLVRTFDPSHGMRIFIGQWTVKVYIDGKHRSTAHFDVLC